MHERQHISQHHLHVDSRFVLFVQFRVCFNSECRRFVCVNTLPPPIRSQCDPRRPADHQTSANLNILAYSSRTTLECDRMERTDQTKGRA